MLFRSYSFRRLTCSFKYLYFYSPLRFSMSFLFFSSSSSWYLTLFLPSSRLLLSFCSFSCCYICCY